MNFAPWLVRISDDALKFDLAEARGIWCNRADGSWFGCYRLLLCGCIFTDDVVLVTALASAFGFELLVPEMGPPSPRPSLVLELDIFKATSI